MGLIQKLNEIQVIKNDIKDSIVEKGGVLEDTTPFSNYAGVIQNLQTEDETDYTDANADYLCYKIKNNNLIKLLCDNIINNDNNDKLSYYNTFAYTSINAADLFTIKHYYYDTTSNAHPFKENGENGYFLNSIESAFANNTFYGAMNLNFNEYLPIGLSSTFEISRLTKLTTNLHNLWVANGRNSFYSCSNLTEIPVLNIENCIACNSMFYNCKKLKRVKFLGRPFPQNYVSGTLYFGRTGSTPSMDSMFYNCSVLESIQGLDITNVNSKITVKNMFYGCSKLTELDFTGTENVQTNFDVSRTGLKRDGLMHMLSTLPTLDHTQTITIGSTKMSLLTDEDIAEFTAKGYTLA